MANEYRLNYTASDIDAKLGVIDGTKTYYTSEEVDEIINNLDQPIYNIIVNQETGKVEQSLDEIVTAAQSGMVLICSGALSLITDMVTENGSFTKIQLTMFALPNTVLPVNIYADGTIEMELSDNMQMKSDKVTSISAESTDQQYPSAKAVYDVLQNIDVVSEWEDIQNKPGDVADEIITKEHIVNLENIQNFPYEEDAGCYVFQNGDVFCEENLSGKEVKVSIRRPIDSEPIICNANVVIPDEEYPEEAFIYVNTTVSDAGEWLEGGFPKIDETLPTFIFMTQGYIYASEDLTGYDIEIYTENIETDYIKLPYEYISNKPGDITTTKTTLSETIQLPSDCYNSNGISYWISNFPNIITVGDNITVQISLSDNTYEQECEVQEFQEDMIVFNFNCIEDPNTAVSNGIIKIDGNMPAFIIVYRTNRAEMYLYSYDNCDGATLTIVKSVLNSTSIKLPNEALNFDTTPIEDSTNLINSGDLYNIIGDIDVAIAHLESLVGGASV